jgi:hypothetical protein
MKRWKMMLFVVVVSVAVLGGCKDFKEDKYVDVAANETAFVVKMDGDSESVKFDSEEALKKLQVAGKRIKIPQFFYDTGRMWYSGEWREAVQVYKVDRTPVSREWVADADRGTSGKNEGLWAESADSIEFSTGFSVTAKIEEENAAKFLYKYPSSSLADVMDSEVRSRIQSIFSTIAAKYTLNDLLRGKDLEVETVDENGKKVIKRTKAEGVVLNEEGTKILSGPKKLAIILAVKADIVDHFSESGITITTCGMSGGFKYGDKDIQAKLNEVFKAEQQKVINRNLFDAQQDENNRIVLAADAKRDAIRKEAEGEADAKLSIATAEADGKAKLLEVAEKAAKNPIFLKMQQIEVEKARWSKWDGVMPKIVMGGADAPSMLMQMPEVE